MPDWLILKKGDQVEILDDFFIVGEFKLKKGYREIELNTKDPEIFSAKIQYYNNNKIIFFITRNIDCKITGKGFVYDGQKYQISNEEKITRLENGNWIKEKILEIYKTGEKRGDKKRLRKAVVHANGEITFYNWQEIELNDISTAFSENPDLHRAPITKKFKIKFKEPVG